MVASEETKREAIRRYKLGEPAKDIAKDIGYSYSGVRTWIRKRVPEKVREKLDAGYTPEEVKEMIKKFKEDCWTLKKIKKEYGITHYILKEWLTEDLGEEETERIMRKNQAYAISQSTERYGFYTDELKDKVLEEYKEGKPLTELSNKYDIWPNTITHWRVKRGIGSNYYLDNTEERYIEQEYSRRKQTMGELEEKLDFDRDTIIRVLNKRGVKKRTQNEARQMRAIRRNGMPIDIGRIVIGCNYNNIYLVIYSELISALTYQTFNGLSNDDEGKFALKQDPGGDRKLQKTIVSFPKVKEEGITFNKVAPKRRTGIPIEDMYFTIFRDKWKNYLGYQKLYLIQDLIVVEPTTKDIFEYIRESKLREMRYEKDMAKHKIARKLNIGTRTMEKIIDKIERKE